jgi:hypothetical protein
LITSTTSGLLRLLGRVYILRDRDDSEDEITVPLSPSGKGPPGLKIRASSQMSSMKPQTVARTMATTMPGRELRSRYVDGMDIIWVSRRVRWEEDDDAAREVRAWEKAWR